MKQKVLILFLALIVGAGTVSAESGTCGANLKWDLTNGVLTISGNGDMWNWSSPSSSSTKVPWYSYLENITSVIIGNSVTSIGDYAFYQCYGLTSIVIPNSVTSIGMEAFGECTSLTSVTIGNSVTSIGNWAFGECTSLTSVTIGNSVTSIGDHAFYYCYGLTSIVIPNSVTSIGIWAFGLCTGLTSVTIPNSVTSIGWGAFGGCSGLTSIIVDSDNAIFDSRNNCNAIIKTETNELIVGCNTTIIPNSVTIIGYEAFLGCEGLTNITIPNSVTSIGWCAFGGCSGLTSITIPNSVTSIGESAFYSCTGLTSLTIPNSVTSIGESAFYSCTGLTSLTIPNSVTNIGEDAFKGCPSLTSIYNYATTPQSIDSEVFGAIYIAGQLTCKSVNKSTCKLYVPQESVSKYRATKGWKDFKNILAIGAEEVEVTTTKATTTSTTATVAWQQITGAASYELIIRDANGNIICTLIFSAQGFLTSITFNAPARGDAPQKTQTAGFEFTVTGLESGTTYNYSITAKNEGGTIINTQSGSFITKSPQGIDDVEAGSKSTKFLHNGQVLIHRGDKTYTITGQGTK